MKTLDISGNWEIIEFGHNILTLDTCDVYFDGELVGENENVPDVLYMALALKKPVQVRCEYFFNVKTNIENCYLVCETPEKFSLSVNGKKVKSIEEGFFVDSAFRKISLNGMLKEGKNIITAEIYFSAEHKIYENLEKAYLFESEKNKLTFDTEFESIYIVGDFSVETSGSFLQLERNTVRYDGDFWIDKKKKFISLQNIEQQGFPFYSGRMLVRKTMTLLDTNYKLQFEKKGINAVNVRVNGVDCGCMMWGHLNCNIAHALKIGENVIELLLVNNLRNMLGPHHVSEGEVWETCPQHFFRRANVWTNGKDMPWSRAYCLAEVGIESRNIL